jgi:Tfp pilus assembly protein PilN
LLGVRQLEPHWNPDAFYVIGKSLFTSFPPNCPVKMIDVDPLTMSAFLAHRAQISFLPSNSPNLKNKNQKRRKVVFMSTLFSASMLFLIMALSINVQNMQRKIKLIDEEIGLMAPVLNKTKEALTKLDSIERIQTDKTSALSVLRSIEGALPAGVVLESLSYVRGQAIVMRGAAVSVAAALKFVTELQAKGTFKTVDLKSTSRRRGRSSDLIDYQIEASAKSL